MGYTKNAYGKPVFDDKYDFPQDSQAAVDYADEFANVRVGTSAQRQDLVAGKRRPGMLWVETDTGDIFRTDTALAWRQNNRTAVFTLSITGFSDSTLASTAIPTSPKSDETTDASFITARTGTACTVRAGIYLCSLYFELAAGTAFSGRAFAEIAAGSTVMNRNNSQHGVGENGVGVTAIVPVMTDGTVIAGRIFKVSGGNATVTGRLTLTKLA